MLSMLSILRTVKPSIVLLAFVMAMAACGSEEPDTFVPPEELCPEGLEVEGIAGRVVNDRRVTTVPNSEVTLVYEDRSRPTTTQDVTGSDVRNDDAVFRFRNVPDGTHTLKACIGSFHANVDLEVVDGTSTFQCLRLSPPGC